MKKHFDYSIRDVWPNRFFAFHMCNIGSEIHRMYKFKDVRDERFVNAFERALELIDLTREDFRFRKRLKETSRIREMLCEIFYGKILYDVDLAYLDKYFFSFCLSPDCKN